MNSDNNSGIVPEEQEQQHLHSGSSHHDDDHHRHNQMRRQSPPHEDRTGDSQQTPTSWGAPVMGSPSNPDAHPLNSQAAIGDYGKVDGAAAADGISAPLDSTGVSQKQEQRGAPIPSSGVSSGGEQQSNPYVQTTPISGSSGTGAGKSPMDMILETLGKFGKNAEDTAEKMWQHLMTGPSVTDTAWGRINQGVKVLTEGGIVNVFRQNFGMASNEQLHKSYACFLSTSTGPVVGTLYISTVKLAFCSDRPLQYNSNPDQRASSYYKAVIPLERVKAVNASANKDKPVEQYIQIITGDDHEFWFMGFVNYNKALKNLQHAIQNKSEQVPG